MAEDARGRPNGRRKVRRGTMPDWQVRPKCSANGRKIDKTIYRSAAKARKAARVEGMRVYQCGKCGGFHLTKQPKGDKPND